MASVSPLKDIDEKFCMCSICLKQFTEPKLLPCLDRYCKDCLDTLIEAKSDIFICPECKQEVQIPTNGAAGFKTDFYTKNLVEEFQIQQSLRSDQMRECFGCSKQLKVTAYCFKCKNFLCQDCHNFHVQNNCLKEHEKYTLSLADIESQSKRVEKLASMRDGPRCLTHAEKISKLLCKTCSNIPVCVTCVLGEHNGHDINEVRAQVKSKKQLLALKLQSLEKLHKSRIFTFPAKAKEKLLSNAKNEEEILTEMHQSEVEDKNTKINNVHERREKISLKRKRTEKETIDSLQKEKDEEIQKINQKFERLVGLKVDQSTRHLLNQEADLAIERTYLIQRLKQINREKEKLLESLRREVNKKLKDIETISDFFENTEKRFRNIQVLAPAIIASENDWTAAQLIPDVQAASENLIEDLKKSFPRSTDFV